MTNDYKKRQIMEIVALSFCVASLGIALLPFMIAGTILKAKQQRGQHQATLTGRTVTVIPPDYLL